MFITLEGPEGSGKSTQLKRLAESLQKEGFAVLATREPGGSDIGDQIRACLHDVNNTAMEPETEFLLYSASRAQLVREQIMPALQAGAIVICDRYADSTLAYQGYGRGLDLATLETITQFATGDLKPDLTFLLDIDVESGLARRVSGAKEMNRLDREAIAFHQRVRAGYHQLAAADPGRWVIVDATQSPDAIQQALRMTIAERLAQTADA